MRSALAWKLSRSGRSTVILRKLKWALQEAIRALLRGLPDTLVKDRLEFEQLLDAAAKKAGLKLPAPARKAILSALSERDETAAICRDKDGNPEPDPQLRDTESVPLPAGDDPVDAARTWTRSHDRPSPAQASGPCTSSAHSGRSTC